MSCDFKRYYALDKYGRIGDQKRSEAAIQKDIQETTAYIKARNTGEVFDFNKFRKEYKNRQK